jgi:hypothetical protein
MYPVHERPTGVEDAERLFSDPADAEAWCRGGKIS